MANKNFLFVQMMNRLIYGTCRSIGERLTLDILSKIYPDSLIMVGFRPIWMRYNTRCLELDFYLPEHKLAVEYNGIQHARPIGTSKRAIKSFSDQVARDAHKISMCHERDVKLIVIPHTIRHSDIRSYLMRMIKC